MKINVREAVERDLENILPVNASARETLRKVYVRTEGVAQISNEASVLLVALTEDRKIVGRCEYSIRDKDIYFSSLGVLEEFRGRGVFRKIFLYLEAIAQENGCCSILCETIAETGNELVFSKVGMIVLGRSASAKYCSPNGGVVHQVLMGKKL